MTIELIAVTIFCCALAGVFAGLMSGILGIGGGLIVVPALLIIFKHHSAIPAELAMPLASGTSLAVMIFTSQASIRAHYKLGIIMWSVYHKLWPGIIIGTISGGILADCVPTIWVKTLLAIFLLGVSLKMLIDIKVTKQRRFPPLWVNYLISYLIGLKSGLLGIGGGTLIIPYLTYCGIEMSKITAVSALCTITVATIGTIIFFITGYHESGLPAYTTGYIYWPAVISVAIPSMITAAYSAQLAYKLPVKQLKLGFVVILFITAIGMLV